MVKIDQQRSLFSNEILGGGIVLNESYDHGSAHRTHMMQYIL